MSPSQTRTHTYYMTYKEYKKWSKTTIKYNPTDNYPTRTHIFIS